MKGDSYYLQIPHAVLPNIENNTSFYPQLDATFQSEKGNALHDFQTAIVAETAIITSLGLLLWGAHKFISPKIEDQKMSRRTFLGKTLTVAAGTLTAGSLLSYPIPTLAGATSNEQIEEFLQTVDTIVRSRLVRSTFTDGRTALLLTKAEDAQATGSELSEATNVVVMGSQHMDIAPTFQHDKDQRNKAITAYAQELLAVAQQVYGNYYHLSLDQIPPQVTNSLLDYVCQTDIVEVTDPGGSSFRPDFPSTVVQQIVAMKSFKSLQVEEAIKDLRPKQQ